MGVRVVTDSACDLPEDLVEQLGIEIVPLTIRFGNEELVDRKELGTGEFWRRLAQSPTLPETSAPSVGAFEEVFRRLVRDGADGIVCINLSSKLSATMQAAQVAAKAVADECPVEVVDSLHVSAGIGTLCIAAARMADAGRDLQTITTEVYDQRDRTKLFGTLDTLEYLRKGGRIGAARALLGSMLSIKPVVEVRDGVVAEAGKVRTRSKALRYLAEKLKPGQFENVSVLHGDAPDIDEFLDLLAPVAPRDEIVVSQIGPVVGTHTGPRVIGMTYQTPH
ncbi:MAG: DegV family protein [Actinobacteria bacterium]|nr:DegV family protein [Actinomycetota bacterium]